MSGTATLTDAGGGQTQVVVAVEANHNRDMPGAITLGTCDAIDESTIYDLNDTLRVTRANTIVLGLGFATLRAATGLAAMTVADVDGVTLAGLLFDAGSTSSPVLLEVGPTGSSASHAANPTSLHDVFFRIGGAGVGKAAVSLRINSHHVIGDHLWLWRADRAAASRRNPRTWTQTWKGGMISRRPISGRRCCSPRWCSR